MSVTRRSFLKWSAAALPVEAAPQRPPNVLTILCDQLNPAVTSVYGGPVSTPNLERLARRGVVFTNTTCPTPFCSPSRASIVTGQYPHRHGIVYNLSRIDYPAIPAPPTEQGIFRSDTTTDKILNAAGYSTHQYGKWHLSGDALPYYPDQYGEHREYAREMSAVFDGIRKQPRERWMDWYGWILPVAVDPLYEKSFGADDAVRKSPHTDFILKAGRLELPLKQTFDARVADHTVERLRSAGSKPFSITCSLNWPHDPNVVPSPYYTMFDPGRIELPANVSVREARFETDLSRKMMARETGVRLREFLRIYYGTVRLIDEQVGRVLDALDATGRADDTIVIFTADHGDMSGSHGMVWKSTSAFYDQIVRIPLLIAWPRRVRPGRTEAAAGLVDLAPTILDLAGHAVPPGMQGASLAPVLLGQSSAARFAFGFCERVRANPARTRSLAAGVKAELMVRGEGWKYIRYASGDEYLYDLRKDPGETRNLAEDRSARSQKEELRSELKAWLDRTQYPA